MGHSFFKSFLYAFQGIKAGLEQERNLRFHLVTALFVLYFSIFYDFGKTEYALLLILICGVISLELVNSAIERAVEKPSPDKFFITGTVKDMAAGAVLVFSLAAAGCGILLFWQPEVLLRIYQCHISSPLRLALLLVAAVAGYIFIFRKEEPPFEDS